MRRAPVVFALLVLAACDGNAPLTAPDGAPDPSATVIDGTTDGNSHFFFLPPLVDDPNALFTAPADASLSPRVEICEWEGGSCVDQGVQFTYTTTTGEGGAVVEVFDDHYQVDWDTQLPGVEADLIFRARVLLVGLELGSVDLQVASNGNEVRNLNEDIAIGLVDNRTLPLSFRIEEGAVEEAETEAEGELCLDDSGNVIDCDVEIIDASEGGSATVVDPTGAADGTSTLAAIIQVEANDAFSDPDFTEPVDEFLLTLLEVAEGPSEELDPDQQIPFFIDVTAVDAEGQSVFFQQGALVVLCQPPDLGVEGADPFVPDELHHSLKLFKVHDDGVTEILDTTIDDGNCPDGLHGGLNTVNTGSFSGFGATLPTEPSLSTAVVPDGTVDIPTEIEIQAMVEPNLHANEIEPDLCLDDGTACEQIFGGDEVVVTVTGANNETLAIGNGIVDNNDGTYTAQYTPTATGTDMIEIEIHNVDTDALESISGSPFTSEVGTQVSLWTGDGTYDDVWSRNDGGPNPAGSVSFDAGIVGQAFRFQRNGGVVAGPGNFIDGLQQLSVSTWVNIDAGSLEREVQRFVTLTSGEKAVIRQNDAPDAGTGRQLHFYMNFGSVAEFDLRHLTADGVLEQGCFNHVVGTYDGADMRLYLNGVEIRSQAVEGTVVTGDGFHFSNAPTFEGLEGLLDEVAVDNRALPASEVAALYSAPSTGQCPQPMAGDVVSVDVQPIGPTLTTGSSLQLSGTPYDAFGDGAVTQSSATWNSANAAVATVDGSGVVTAVSPGEATITATIDGVEGITKVTVQDPIVLDGVMSPGEWPGSAFGFAANLPEGGTTPATFHWQVQGGNFYAAVRFERSALDEGNTATVEFGPDPSGESAGVKDIILVNGPNSFVDDVRLPDGTAPRDVDVGGTTDGAGTLANDGTHTIYEMAHPLDSEDDLYDFSLQPGDQITLQLRLRMINGGQLGDSTVPTPALTIIIP